MLVLMVEYSERINRIEKLVSLLETDLIKIPIINLPIGLDGVIGLVPFIGDLLTGVLSLGIALYLTDLTKLSWQQLLGMYTNVGIDILTGSVPIFGDIFDFFFKANYYNLNIAKAAAGFNS